MLSTYYIELRTGTDYTVSSYNEAAGRLGNLLVTILSDPITLDTLLPPYQSCKSEVEISLEGDPRELVGKAVVDVVADKKAGFDKAKLTKLVKAAAEAEEWPRLKVLKKAVPT